MKLNRKKLRKMILNEIKNITESQKMVGLPHKYSHMELYHHALRFLRQHPDLKNASPEIQQQGEMLLRILNNAVIQAVKHSTYRRGSMNDFIRGRVSHDEYLASIGHHTSPEETKHMRDVQGNLKMARNALADSLGLGSRYSGGGGRRDALSQRMRELDPTGSRQKYGRFTPADDPQLRKNMPEYQPGGRHYDPDDPIHKK